MTVSMPDSLKQFLDHESEEKGYGDVSESIRSVLFDVQSQANDAHLESLLLDELDGGDDIPITPAL